MTFPPTSTVGDPGVDHHDWWYVRAYPGASSLQDHATKVIVPWLRAQARELNATHWFFMRYFDLRGQHLRLRLRADADAVDVLHGRGEQLHALLCDTAGDTAPHGRLIPGADFGEMPCPTAVTPALYTPELEKYGGPGGVAVAESLFTTGSAWFDDQHVAALPSRFDRAALAVALMRATIETALPPQAHATFWAAHQRQWGTQLRMFAPTRSHFSVLLDEAAAGVATSSVLDPGRRAAVDELSAAICGTLDAAALAGVPVARDALLLEYLHMEMNRWGLMPAEECLLGLFARTPPGPTAPTSQPLTNQEGRS